MDEDEMFQDAAQSLLDGQAAQGGESAGAGADGEGGMPAKGAEGANTENNEGANTENTSADSGGGNAAQNEPAKPDAQQAADAAPQPVNYEGISGGLVKSADDITRISSEYRNMQKELTDLREKIKVDPFANEFARSINQMQADGKSPEQVNAFIKLQNLGDISKLPPLEAMIQAKVLREGRDADLARRQIERKYEITPDMDPLDRELAEANMADDAKSDYEYLQSQKKELAAPKAPVQEEAANVLSQEAIRLQVDPIKEKVKEQFTTMGNINLNGKVDKDGKPTAEAVFFDLPVPNEFRDKIPALVQDFFVNQQLPVTEDNLKTAIGVINYELFNQYGVKIIQDACNAYGTQLEKRIRDEYEHKGDLKQKDRVHQPINANQLEDEFLEQYATGG